MKVIWEFEDDDRAELETHRMAIEYEAKLSDIYNKCRSILKHGDPNKDPEQVLEEIRDLAWT